MSITSKISAAIAVTAFGLLGLGAIQLAAGPHPASTSVVADNPWGTPATTSPAPAPDSVQSESATGSDDNPWG